MAGIGVEMTALRLHELTQVEVVNYAKEVTGGAQGQQSPVKPTQRQMIWRQRVGGHVIACALP